MLMFALRVEAKVNTVGSSSSYCKGRACTKHFPDRGRSFGFHFPKLIKSREELESVYLLFPSNYGVLMCTNVDNLGFNSD